MSKENPDWVPCCPGCCGIAPMDNGYGSEDWVEIQKCDDCNRFQYDEDAAEEVSSYCESDEGRPLVHIKAWNEYQEKWKKNDR